MSFDIFRYIQVTCFGIKNTNYALAIFQASLDGTDYIAVHALHFPFNIHKAFWLLKSIHGNNHIYAGANQANSSTLCPNGTSRSKNLADDIVQKGAM
jgi:hypothetical protein